MGTLIEVCKRNTGRQSLFSEIFNIDFYDGTVEALCKLVESEQWYVCSMVYFDIDASQRIYTLLNLDGHWILRFTPLIESYTEGKIEYYEILKEEVQLLYKEYSGDIFLFKGEDLGGLFFEVTKLPKGKLKYFNNIESVLSQTKYSKRSWLKYFLKG